MPNPRRKISRSKRDKRRASWAIKLKSDHLSLCENCSEMKLPHHACPHCGHYRGRAVHTPESAS